MSSQPIGKHGSTTEFFRASPGRIVNWSAIQSAKTLHCDRDDVVIVSASGDKLSIHAYVADDRDAEKLLTRILNELTERTNLLAGKSLESRTEDLEKQMICLWNAPGGPGYEAARSEFEELRKERLA
ncbi:hypothetical protein HDU87_007640 [Geranomyces variabilis]|uniref:Uncharacterized protein n=1 Tax=Geranomyces variabilis TaxID=109894 RepID=A0AAD5XMM9_9FUNG|nr:hypothetical protein HDU87_007640 [Geranomyces variabilis]